MELAGEACEKKERSCRPTKMAICSKKHMDCSDEECVQRECPTVDCAAPPPPHCRKSEENGPDGCPLFPCDFVCDESCSDEEIMECEVKSVMEGTEFECRKPDPASEAKCEVIGCRLPSCMPPPEGCEYIPVDKMNFFGCPVMPCGRLHCPAQSCEKMAAVRCAHDREFRKDCIMDDVTGDPMCIPPLCPVVDCQSLAKPGCKFVAAKAEDLLLVDKNGCPKFPCGREVCERTCNKEQMQECCDPALPPSECGECIADEGDNFHCLPREHLCENMEMCVPAPGCVFEPWGARQKKKACEHPCGKEVCRAFNPCDEMECAEDETCHVPQVPGILSGFEAGICVPKRIDDPCAQCESGRCVKHARSSSKPVECLPVDPCENVECPFGMVCLEYDSATSERGEPTCVDVSIGRCREACGDEEECRLVREESDHMTTEVYKCARPEAEKPVKDIDMCGFLGFPCFGDDEECMVIDGEPQCEIPGEHVRNYDEIDPCAMITCDEGMLCSVEQGLYAVCEPAILSLCTGIWCPENHVCDELTGACLPLECDGQCGEGMTCVNDNGFHFCAPDFEDMCPDTWTHLQGVCQVDEDCGADGGMFCPGPEDPEACVSQSCKCDPFTGLATECSSACHEDFRRCLPNKWSCTDAEMSAEEKGWCCRFKEIGCDSYQCEPTEHDHPMMWSKERKEWCNQRSGGMLYSGIEVQDLLEWGQNAKDTLNDENENNDIEGHFADAFNCFTSEPDFFFEKAQYCCNKFGVHCPAASYDCSAGRRKDWDEAKRGYCCMFEDKGCRKKDRPTYDCTTDERWSRKKKRFCCDAHPELCEEVKPLFTCENGDVTQWSDKKKYFCCEKRGLGCSADTAEEGPFHCDALSFVSGAVETSARRREWCCRNHRVGCQSEEQCFTPTLFTDPATDLNTLADMKDKCCRDTGVGCQFTCEFDSAAIGAMTAPQKRFCCDVKGVGCDMAELTAKKEEGVLEQQKSHRASAMVSLSFKLDYNDVGENLAGFVEECTRSLTYGMLSIDDELEGSLSIMSVGPAGKRGEKPKNGTSLHKQWMDIPSEWSLHCGGLNKTVLEKLNSLPKEATEDIPLIDIDNFGARRGASTLNNDNEKAADGGESVVSVEVMVNGECTECVQKHVDVLTQLSGNPQLLAQSYGGDGRSLVACDSCAPVMMMAPKENQNQNKDTTADGGAHEDEDSDSAVGAIVAGLFAAAIAVGIAGVFITKHKRAKAGQDNLAAFTQDTELIQLQDDIDREQALPEPADAAQAEPKEMEMTVTSAEPALSASVPAEVGAGATPTLSAGVPAARSRARSQMSATGGATPSMTPITPPRRRSPAPGTAPAPVMSV